MQAILLYNIVTVTKQQRGSKMEQWQIELIQQWVADAQKLENSETWEGVFYSGRAQAFRSVLHLIAGEEGVL